MTTYTNSRNAEPSITDGAQHVAEQGNIAAARNVDSPTNAYIPVREECNVAILDGTSAVPIGGGAANDTHLMGVLIPKNAGPATCTLTGFGKTTDGINYTAKSILLTGSTADDRYFDFGGALNNVGALTAQGSVDEIVTVFWRPV